jgi:NTE family protein
MTTALGRTALFEGLGAQELDAVASSMRERTFEPREVICRAGDAGDSVLLILDGLARVLLEDADSGELKAVARLRRGDVVGEMSLVTSEPRTATVIAGARTTALELGREGFADLISAHPRILANLNQILSHKLAETTARVGEPAARGEAIGLLVGAGSAALVPELLAAAEAASVGTLASLDARSGPESVLAALDDVLAEHATALVIAELGDKSLASLVDAVDRAVVLLRTEAELKLLAGLIGRDSSGDQRIEIVVLADSPQAARLTAEASSLGLVVRVSPNDAGAPPPEELAWLGRHLSRTKLGLALGAGGAKGYAHVGALRVLEEAGYTVDYVAGSSIGAIVGAWLALGLDSSEIEATLRNAFTPEAVAEIFKLSFSGASTGLETMTRILRETTQDKTFADLDKPLVVMTVDLNGRCAAPVSAGPLWEALLAATSLAGIFPPYERDGQRLVDGLALVPVPTDAVLELGADITVAVNIISSQALPAWPGEAPPADEPPGPRSRMLDTMLEVMDLAQMHSSERHAARADVPVTPLFGPSSWRDFHLADLFLEAGRRAAEEQLPLLQSLARPQLSRLPA